MSTHQCTLYFPLEIVLLDMKFCEHLSGIDLVNPLPDVEMWAMVVVIVKVGIARLLSTVTVRVVRLVVLQRNALQKILLIYDLSCFPWTVTGVLFQLTGDSKAGMEKAVIGFSVNVSPSSVRKNVEYFKRGMYECALDYLKNIQEIHHLFQKASVQQEECRAKAAVTSKSFPMTRIAPLDEYIEKMRQEEEEGWAEKATPGSV
uniref:Tubulin_C domain-containing protein n=1 Tax=Angiostrongylus cantonensis TaxID=6313 RepID=A0A0K0DDZ5_ANGCA